MLFNSLSFIFLFLPITMLGFDLLARLGRRPVLLWLTAASLVFYGVWNPPFLLFLLGSIAVNFAVSRRIAAAAEGSHSRKRWLTAGVVADLALLFYFKYLYKALLLLAPLHLRHVHPHPVLLPLGISFFTFTQISFLVDLAQGQAEAQDLLSYMLFVTFFPHLIAGPILHHREMMPQFADPEPADDGGLQRFGLSRVDVSLGSTWFLLGLAKKVLIADRLAPRADISFSHAGLGTAATAWTGLIVYSMQLYFDFSGYSDMALGLARIFSIRFPFNFDSPYQATSITEYWQRWHITLTRYITLYLYNPLLRSVQRRRLASGRKISRKALRTPGGFTHMIAYPTLGTMLLTGLWHGAGLQFVIFGALHGVYLTVNQAWRHFRHAGAAPAAPTTMLRRLPLMIGVYVQVIVALVFFRATSLHAAIAMLGDLAGRHGRGHVASLLEGALAFALFPVVWFLPNTQSILGQEPANEHAVATADSAPADRRGRRHPRPAQRRFPAGGSLARSRVAVEQTATSPSALAAVASVGARARGAALRHPREPRHEHAVSLLPVLAAGYPTAGATQRR